MAFLKYSFPKKGMSRSGKFHDSVMNFKSAKKIEGTSKFPQLNLRQKARQAIFFDRRVYVILVNQFVKAKSQEITLTTAVKARVFHTIIKRDTAYFVNNFAQQL